MWFDTIQQTYGLNVERKKEIRNDMWFIFEEKSQGLAEIMFLY